MTAKRDDDQDGQLGVIERMRLRALPAASGPAFPLSHEYFEIVYAPLVGPSSVLLARAMFRHLDSAGGSTTVLLAELAMEVGVRGTDNKPMGKRSHLARSIDRLVHDRIVVRQGVAALGVRIAVPPLNDHTLDKLPPATRAAHRVILKQLDAGSG